MTDLGQYRLARGIRLKREADGRAMLLVPEGIVTLNATAADILELADGERSLDEIVARLAATFDDADGTLRDDVRDLLDEFAARGYVLR